MTNRAPKTHCPSGHALEGDNLRINTRGHRICVTCAKAQLKVYREANAEKRRVTTRRCHREARRRGDRRYGISRGHIENKITRDQVEKVFEAVRETGLIKGAYPVLGRSKTRALLFFKPKVRAAVERIKARFAKQQRAITITNLIEAPAIAARCPANTERVMQRIAVAMPGYLQRDLRDDVVADMVLAWWSGQLNERDIERRAAEFERVRFKSDHNRYGDLSLDVPLWIDTNTTLLDTLASGTSGLWD
jgi:hypothetical protein